MEDIREVQMKGYDIMKVVVEMCEKYHLQYYLSSGTLLGAIRHNGFIPWDNDIDIEMPLPDYRKFLRICKKKLPAGLFLQTYYSDPGYNEMWAKVRVNNSTALPVAWKDLDIHWGVGIDIFPLVGIYEVPLLRKLQVKLHGLCRTLLAKDFAYATETPELSNRKIRLIFAIPGWVRIGLCRIIERFTFRSIRHAKYISMVHSQINYPMESRAYADSRTHTFETGSFQIPEDYEHILTNLYGDYMTPPPESERNGHEGSLGKIIYDCERSYKEYLKELRE